MAPEPPLPLVSRVVIVLLTLLGPTAAATPLIPDSASGAGSDSDPWPEANLLPAVVVPNPSEPRIRPTRPLLVPLVVPVGDLALQVKAQPTGASDAAARPPLPLHYPLAVRASEQDPWGWRYSTARGAWRMHTGVDLIAAEGTAVLAVQAGRVQRVDLIEGYGLTVLIDHGAGWTSLYAHLQHASVNPGDSVRAGQSLGTVGQSGSATTPHLHLELRQRQPQGLVAVDPTPLLPAAP